MAGYSGGPGNTAARADEILRRDEQYLLQNQKVLPNQFVLMDGGIMNNCEVEAWIVPPSAIIPKPKLREP